MNILNGTDVDTQIVIEGQKKLAIDRAKGIDFSDDGSVLLKYPDTLTDSIYEVPFGVVEIGNRAFERNKTLTHVYLASSITRINWNAFTYCSCLEEVIIPESVTEIESGAFMGCSSLRKIQLPSKLTTISFNTFLRCYKLTEIQIPKGVTAIGNKAFGACFSLTEIFVPEGVIRIGDFVFTNCHALIRAYLPDSIEKIGTGGVFAFCKNLRTVRWPDHLEVPLNTFLECNRITKKFRKRLRRLGYKEDPFLF